MRKRLGKNLENIRPVINMRSTANSVKGQGVGSAYDEQVSLIKTHLGNKFIIKENSDNFADITHFHTVNFPYYIFLPFVKHMGVCVGYVHFLPETVENSLSIPWLFKKIFYKYLIAFYKSMDYLVTVNPYFIDCLAAYGIPKEKVFYIPNYVDDSKFHILDEDKKSEIRKKYNIEENKFTVVSAGQLQTRKGVFDFIECAKRLPDIQFVWAGGFSFGKMTDGYEKIKEAVENPPENVKFLGIIDREDMNGIYNIGDVMFLASFEELFPMTILEAMNCKKPLLLRDIEIYENILFDFYQKADDVDGFVKIIKSLRDDEVFYKTASEKSFNGNKFYNKKHVVSLWNNFYSEIITQKLPERFKRQERGEKKLKKGLQKMKGKQYETPKT